MEPKITVAEGITLVSLHNISANMSLVADIFEKIGELGVDVDVISMSPVQSDLTSLSFTVNDEDAIKLIQSLKKISGFSTKPTVSTGNYIISVLDDAMENQPGFAAKIFRAIARVNTDIRIISTSEIQISMVVTEADFESALKAVKDCAESLKQGIGM